MKAGERVVTEGGDRLDGRQRRAFARDRTGRTSAQGPVSRNGRPAQQAGEGQTQPGAQRRPARQAALANSRLNSAMSPSRPFILRPVATSLFMVAIVLGGLVGFHFLPLSALPEVDYPTIQVQTLYPGASPEVMSRPSPRRWNISSGRCPA